MKKISINEWFNDLRIKRINIYKDSRETEAFNTSGIVETFHTDSLQLVFELLQNADDAGADKANFEFKKNLINFNHNGSEFTRSNVQKITGIGYTDKQESQIGKFGMGFKSVYKITNQPLIYTSLEGRKFNFKIRNIIIPEKIEETDKFTEKIGNINKSTTFKLKINPATPSDFYQKCKQFIEKNEFKFLLFLNNLKEIKFNILNIHYSFRKIEIGKDKIRIKTKKNNKEKEFNFYVYRQKIDFSKKNKNAYIIFAFLIGGKGHFYRSPIKTNLHIFLETHENTGLNFYMHAPFIPNSSRTEINLEDKNNKKILDNCVDGFFNLIQKLKKSKLLNISFIEVLPNCDQQNDSNKFVKLHAKIQECLARWSVWPCTDQSYQIARNVKLWNLCQENIFTNYDLQLLTGNQSARWLKENKHTSKSIILKQHLEVHEISKNNIFDFFHQRSDIFLCTKSLSWLFNFYKLMDSLKIYDLPIIKAQNNSYKYGKDLRFSNLTSNELELLNYVHEDFDKKFKPKKIKFLRNFFESCGVREVNKHDQIKSLLDTYFPKTYRSQSQKVGNNYSTYLNMLVDYYAKQSDTDLLKSYKIFIDQEKRFSNHWDLFIDDKDLTTYLSNIGEIISKRKMFIPQSIKNRKELISMAIELGVIKSLPMKTQFGIFRNHRHPKYKEMIEDKFGESLYFKRTGREGYVDEEYKILFLDKLLNLQKSLPKEKAKKIAYAIANTLNGTSKSDRQASFRPRKNQRTKYEKSSFMYILMETEWIPQKDGSFKKPKDSIKKKTDKKFLSLVTKNEQIQTWLSNEMDFASSESIQKNITKTEKDDEKKHGLPPGSIKKIKQNKWTKEEIAEANEYILNKRQKSHSKKEDQELVTASSSHPSEAKEDEPRTEERGSEYVEEEDHEKKTIVKVRVTSKEKKIMKNNKRKLKETHYLNHCQICCLATDKTFNEDFLVKSLGAINRKKLMDVHHIHSIGKNGPKTPPSNMLVLCNNHHYGFVKSYGCTEETLNLVHNLVKQNKEKTEAQLIKMDGTIARVSGYKITMTNNDYELFFTESHVKEFLE